MAQAHDLKKLEPRLLALWKHEPSRGLGVREIRAALGLDREENRFLQGWLHDLTRQGVLRLKGSRYTPAPLPAEVLEVRPLKAGIAASGSLVFVSLPACGH